ncbi:EscU/YscU/HrcU family type III secretion system export apparatus switch protein [Paenibacillus profundus]|uniref:EscU/YscU/HrcU family type III secretion system export apparatus switch protein n=1 Tax=Paenibacillus profundus TaxID=1173085 RepID=A0ABS8YEV6_9BACL|nr:EscU/YscU/HrcU family type III secretion system export apparatus switch protein [Paenibacillus profundus]MCE5168039.1 EscU/YscU/HrcU family type III secretion system export apparatus switch protein [Paenibacillus profundus]
MRDPGESTQQTGPYQRKKAVALSYDPQQSDAPILVAKGQGQLAERILDKARESGVPVQEDASLVEVLSKLDIDQQIPSELYHLVAEVLTFMYRTDQRAEKGWMKHE